MEKLSLTEVTAHDRPRWLIESGPYGMALYKERLGSVDGMAVEAFLLRWTPW